MTPHRTSLGLLAVPYLLQSYKLVLSVGSASHLLFIPGSTEGRVSPHSHYPQVLTNPSTWSWFIEEHGSPLLLTV